MRGGRGRPVPRASRRGTPDAHRPARPRPACLHPQAERGTAAARHPDHSGPGGPDRRPPGAGADLRGGLPAVLLRLPPEEERPPGRGGGRPRPRAGLHAGARRRPDGLLRFHPPRSPPGRRGPPRERPAHQSGCSASGSARRWSSSGRMANERSRAASGRVAGLRRVGRSPRCSRTSPCMPSTRHGERSGLERRLQARLIRDADDFVICCRQTAAQVQPLVTQQLQALGLTLNPAKTRVLDARQQPFTFLGFTVRVARSWRRGTWFPLTQPSAAARQELREAVRALTGRDRARRPTPDVITEVNRVVQGWGGDLPLPPLHGGLQRPQRVRLRSGPHLPAAQASGVGPAGIAPSRLPCCTGGSVSTGCRSLRRRGLRRLPCGEGDRRAGCGQTARPVR